MSIECGFANVASKLQRSGAACQSIQRIHVAWSSYWAGAVDFFERLAAYSRQTCCGDSARAAWTWTGLTRASIPEILTEKLHELCNELQKLVKLCRSPSFESCNVGACRTWAQVGDALDALREMIHEDSSLEWAELRHALQASAAPTHLPPPDPMASLPPPNPLPPFVAAGSDSAKEDDFPTAPAPHDARGQLRFERLQLSRAPRQIFSHIEDDALETEEDLESELADEPCVEVRTTSMLSPGSARSTASPSRAYQATPDQGAVAPASTAYRDEPVTRTPQRVRHKDNQTRAQTPSFSWSRGRHSGGTEKGARSFSSSQSPDRRKGGTSEAVKALKVLQHVESEVRTLKLWYTEAIQAMHSPPVPSWSEVQSKLWEESEELDGAELSGSGE